MTKKKSESKIWWTPPLFGLIALIGATMAIFEIPYGYEIALTGALWFTASFMVAMFYLAAKEHIEDREKHSDEHREKKK